MKKLLALLLATVFVFALSACDDYRGAKNNNTNTPTQSVADNAQQQTNQTQSEAEPVTRDRAIELALAHAGLALAEVYDLEAELDRERGGTYWEVDFEYKNIEHSYDINAQTGEITRLETERD